MAYGVTPARGTLLRLDRAFSGFFRRIKAGDKPGFPRFKSAPRWDSVEYPDAQSWKVESSGRTGRLNLQGIGNVRYRSSKRGVVGRPKTLVVKREGRRWRAYIACQVEAADPMPATGRQVGIDLGVEHLMATSEGQLVDNERHTRRSRERLASAQRLVAGRTRGSARRRKAGQRVGYLHRRIARQRRDGLHKLSRSLISDYDLIVHEDLKIANMTRRPKPMVDSSGGYAPNGATAKAGLNREILSAGWGVLLGLISYKAAEAGRKVISVDPRHTSQTCNACGRVDAGNRDGTEFRCLGCGHADHADINAARNILRAGLALRLERAA
jgi:putative transposase